MNVMMLHSLGCQYARVPYSGISLPWEHFEDFCRYLAVHQYRTAFLNDWLYHKEKGLRDSNIYLTFDDGFLDNWVYAYPIAKKYSVKFTVFINPEFISSTKVPRQFFTRTDDDDLRKTAVGYLNWPEILDMSASGLVDFQSHTMSHTWYPVSNKVICIYTEDMALEYPWLIWNSDPGNKPDYLNSPIPKFLYGQPVFENGRSLGVRKYIISDAQQIEINAIAESAMQHHVKLELAVATINDQIYRQRIWGRMETDQELHDRYYYEIAESKKSLEARLDKQVDFLCWPGGAYNDLGIRISHEVGYKASTLASRGDVKPTVFPGYWRIPRFGISSYWYEKNGRSYYHKKVPIYTLHWKTKGSKPLAIYGLGVLKRFRQSTGK